MVQRIAAALPTTVPPNTRLAERLAEALAIVLDYAPLEQLLNAPALLLIGPVGAGKTTLAAKLAARIEHQPAHLLTSDAGDSGRAQISEFARALGVPLTVVPLPEALSEPTAITATRIVDTAGIAVGDDLAWEGFRPWIAASQGLPVLVLPANISVEDAIVAARAFRALGGRHFVVTRFDMVRRVGGVLGAAMEGLALAGVSITPHFAYGLRPLTAETLAWRLLSGALEDERWRAPAA
jgi:flagellar biosynthesis protein FlhF